MAKDKKQKSAGSKSFKQAKSIPGAVSSIPDVTPTLNLPAKETKKAKVENAPEPKVPFPAKKTLKAATATATKQSPPVEVRDPMAKPSKALKLQATPAVAPEPAKKATKTATKKAPLTSTMTDKPRAVSPAAAIQTPTVNASFETGKRVLIVTSECTPLASAGGLGDAVAGLSKALKRRGHDVRIVMPLYRSIDRNKFGLTFRSACCVHFGHGEEIWVGIYEAKLGEVPIWFVDYERYFGRPGLYDEPSGPDNGYRFGVLSKAALQLCKDYQFYPHIAHVHDWMSSPVSVFLKTWDRILSPLSETASVLTIHNLGYQGKAPRSILSFYGLGQEYFHPDAFEDHGAVNLLKAGIQFSDVVTTVSPTYAREILSPIGGQGLAMYLERRRGDLFGILNGVDTEVWNPATDKYLPGNYSSKNLAGKAACKAALQKEFGLEVNPKLPIFGIVSRFAPQKGFDLVRGALPQALRDMHIQVVALGSGDRLTENFMRWMATAFPGKANAHIGFNQYIAHLIEAGSDFFIMPSLYEPCGLNQMYSSLYGTLPIVRATGGLDDTVENYDESTGGGTGFKFWDINDRALFYTLGWANSTWWDRPHHYAAMQLRGMNKDFTWENAAKEYERVYEIALKKKLAR